VRVLHPGRDEDLAAEALEVDAGEIGGEELDDDAAAERAIEGDEDPTHPAAAQLPLDDVAVAEPGLQEVEQRVAGDARGG
jgi:hypothetical protein